MKKHITSILTLFCICAIVAVALAVCNGITKPIIEEMERKAALAALPEVLPGTTVEDFKEMDVASYNVPSSVKLAYQAPGYGFVIQIEFSGFEKGNIVMVGVSEDGKITGTKIITNKESAGFGQDVLPQIDASGHFNGADVDTIDGVDTIAGCTVSSKGYRSAIKDALNAAIVLSGSRTAEQILIDNLNTALGVTSVDFEKLILTDDIVGVEAIYVATNGAGHVAVINGNFVGVDVEGNFVASVDGKTNPITLSEEDKTVAMDAISSVKNVTYTDIDLSAYPALPAGIKSAQVSSKGVYVIVVEYTGYKEGNSVEVTIADGKVIATKVLVNNDTPSYGGATIPELDANGHFNGATLDTIDGVDTVAGVTVSSKTYRAAIKDALIAVTNFSGGSYVDPFTAALNEALGTEGVEFEKHFFIQVIEGVDAIYVAKTGEGYVVVIGDTYVGVDVNGNVVGEANATAANAIAKIKSTTVTDIDLSAYSGVSKRVKSAQVTNEGVYILEVEGSGFGKKGDSHSHPSGEYIVIRIALTADGKIIDCYTVYQSESAGFGDVCGTEEFYGQFAGKTQDNYEDIIIAGSTYTTDGYHGAIKNAFKAVAKFVEGGAN